LISVIGTSYGTSNITSGVNSGNVVLVGYNILRARDFVDPKGGGSKSSSLKFVSGWVEDGSGRVPGGLSTDFVSAVETVVSNASLLVSGTISPTSGGGKSSTNAAAATDFKISAKIAGVWQDGSNTISGSIGAPKK
jgi:hypothetical protein